METLASITKIRKLGKHFYVKAIYNNTYIDTKISLNEAAQLEVGQQIKIKWWWNEDSNGSSSCLIRPIQIFQNQEPKYRVLND